MEIKLTEKQFRRLLDLVYIGNWVLNSTRGDDRIRQYDQVESLIFSHCLSHGMAGLTELYQGEIIPSRAFAEGGIHHGLINGPSWPCGKDDPPSPKIWASRKRGTAHRQHHRK